MLGGVSYLRPLLSHGATTLGRPVVSKRDFSLTLVQQPVIERKVTVALPPSDNSNNTNLEIKRDHCEFVKTVSKCGNAIDNHVGHVVLFGRGMPEAMSPFGASRLVLSALGTLE